MIRRDYLIKQMEEFGKVIARLLTIREKGDHGSLELEIIEAGKQFTDLDINQVEQLQPEDLTALALGLEDHTLKMLADLLFEKLQYYILVDDQEEYTLMKYRCLKLYDLVKARNMNSFDMDVYYKLQFLQSV